MVDKKQAVNLGLQYANGAQAEWVSATSVKVLSGQLRDSSNCFDVVISSDITLSTAASGKNGLDTGTIANSTMYKVYVIYDSSEYNEVATLLSAGTTPVMPAGYDSYLLVGYALTDGSAELLKFWQEGNGLNRTHHWENDISVLSAGAATAFTAVPLTAAVPAGLNSSVKFQFSFTPNAAGDKFGIRPTGSAATVAVIESGSAAGVVKSAMFDTLALNASVDYLVDTSGALDLSVRAFNFTL